MVRGDARRSFAPDVPGIAEVLHASLTVHRYPKHCHDTWTVLLIDDGAVDFELGGRRRRATTSNVTILPPFVAHDGRSAQDGRPFRKRVLYLEDERLAERLIGPAVDRPHLADRQLRRCVSAVHDALGRGPDDLELETLLTSLVRSISSDLSSSDGFAGGIDGGPAESLKAELDRRPFERHRLGDLATRLGWTEQHLIRSFTSTYGLPPHRYLVSRRIDEARRQLLDGVPPAEVAVNVGFFDQAHLGRHFKAHTGTTPARFTDAA